MRSSRLKIAWFSPLVPESGVTPRYSAEVLPLLGGEMDIEIFVDDATVEAVGHRWRGFPVRSAAEYELDKLESHYDIAICQMDNDEACGFVYKALLATPALVILHEPTLYEFMLGILRDSGKHGDLAYEYDYNYGIPRVGFIESHPALSSLPEGVRFPLIQRLIDCSLGIITHNRVVYSEVLLRHPRGPVAILERPFEPAGLVDTYTETVRSILYQAYHDEEAGGKPGTGMGVARDVLIGEVARALGEMGVEPEIADLMSGVSTAVDSLFAP